MNEGPPGGRSLEVSCPCHPARYIGYDPPGPDFAPAPSPGIGSDAGDAEREVREFFTLTRGLPGVEMRFAS
jgi:hypothetical protein